MAIPVVIAAAGGLPVTIAASGIGAPMEVAANGYGIPVTLVASGGLPVVGATLQPLTPLVTDGLPHAQVTAARPAYRVPRVDPVFGVPVIRWTDDQNAQILGMTPGYVWGGYKRHSYMRIQPWNCTETLFYVETNQGGYAGNIYLNGETGAPLYCNPRPSGWGDARWSHTNPNEQIYSRSEFDGGVHPTIAQLRSYNPVTQSDSLIHDFANLQQISIGQNGGVPSVDDDIWPIYGILRSDQTTQVLVIYKRSTDTVLSTITLVKSASGGDMIISPDGLYAFIYYNDETSSVYQVNGTLVRHRNGASQTQQPSHGSMAMDGANAVMVGGDRGSGGSGNVVKVRMDSDAVTTIKSTAFTYHTSTSVAKGAFKDKWVSTDYWPDSDNGNGVFVNEIDIVAVDGSAFARICHVHKGSTTQYETEVHSCLSPTGKRIAFKSVWESAGIVTDVYIADFRNFKFGAIG